MSSISVKSNGKEVFKKILGSLTTIKNPEYLLRPVCIELLPEITKRIHEEGRASDGGPIGTYSPGYLNYRKNHGRGDDPKVILSLTTQLESDWAVLETQKGYAIGFLSGSSGKGDSLTSKKKLEYVEKAKGKKIGELTKEEVDFALESIKERVHEAIANPVGQ